MSHFRKCFSREKNIQKRYEKKWKLKYSDLLQKIFVPKIHAKFLPSFCWFFHRDYVRKKSVKIFWTWKVFRWVISPRAWWHFWLWFPKFIELIRQHIAFDKTCPLKKKLPFPLPFSQSCKSSQKPLVVSGIFSGRSKNPLVVSGFLVGNH